MTEETMQATEEVELPVEESESSPEVNENEDNALEAEATEQKPEDAHEEDPEWYVKAINRQHKKYRDEERRRLELEQQLAQYQHQKPQDDRPHIPPPPDPFDEDYEKKVAERDVAIRRAAEWESRQQAEMYYRQQQEQQAIQQRATQLRSTLQTYTERAKEFGIRPEQLQTAGNAVATMGIHDDVATYILSDDKGPLITTYLARHPADLEAMQAMSPVQAAVYVATKVRQKAESAHGITKAPPPPQSLDGGGAPPRNRGPRGATFE